MRQACTSYQESGDSLRWRWGARFVTDSTAAVGQQRTQRLKVQPRASYSVRPFRLVRRRNRTKAFRRPFVRPNLQKCSSISSKLVRREFFGRREIFGGRDFFGGRASFVGRKNLVQMTHFMILANYILDNLKSSFSRQLIRNKLEVLNLKR